MWNSSWLRMLLVQWELSLGLWSFCILHWTNCKCSWQDVFANMINIVNIYKGWSSWVLVIWVRVNAWVNFFRIYRTFFVICYTIQYSVYILQSTLDSHCYNILFMFYSCVLIIIIYSPSHISYSNEDRRSIPITVCFVF